MDLGINGYGSFKGHEKWLNQSIQLEVNEAENRCILLHGFGGSPYDLYPLACALHAQQSMCMIPIIDGQQQMTQRKHILSADMLIEDSSTHLERAFQHSISHKHPTFMIGFSMGGALSIIHAKRFRPTALILLAPYLGLKQGRWMLEHIGKPLARFFPPIPKLAEGRIASKAGRQQYKSGSRWLSLPAVLELEKIAAEAREAITQLDCPILWCHAPADPVADYERVKELLPAHAEHLECRQSEHVLLFDHDSELVIQQILNFIQSFPIHPQCDA